MSYKILYFDYYLNDENQLCYTTNYFTVGRIQDIYTKCKEILIITKQLFNYAKNNFSNNIAFLPAQSIRMPAQKTYINDVNIDKCNIFSTRRRFFREFKNHDSYGIIINPNNIKVADKHHSSPNLCIYTEYDINIDSENIKKSYSMTIYQDNLDDFENINIENFHFDFQDIINQVLRTHEVSELELYTVYFDDIDGYMENETQTFTCYVYRFDELKIEISIQILDINETLT